MKVVCMILNQTKLHEKAENHKRRNLCANISRKIKSYSEQKKYMVNST